MRIKEDEKRIIVQAVKGVDPDARIYLFGSRVDDRGKGGDIDILILSEKVSYQDKLAIKKQIFSEIEEQKIDLLISKDGHEPFVKMIFEQGVRQL